MTSADRDIADAATVPTTESSWPTVTMLSSRTTRSITSGIAVSNGLGRWRGPPSEATTSSTPPIAL